jgi:hypothetical protein
MTSIVSILPKAGTSQNLHLWLGHLPSIPGAFSYGASGDEMRIFRSVGQSQLPADWYVMPLREVTTSRRLSLPSGASILAQVQEGDIGQQPDLDTMLNQRILLVGTEGVLAGVEWELENAPMRITTVPLPA